MGCFSRNGERVYTGMQKIQRTESHAVGNEKEVGTRYRIGSQSDLSFRSRVFVSEDGA